MTFREHIAKAMEQYAHIKVQEGDYTIGAFISAVMEIEDETEAQEFWHGYIGYMTAYYPERPAEPVCRSNIGWCFGEGMSSNQRDMWIKVSGASHPIFGWMQQVLIAAGIETGAALMKATPEETFTAAVFPQDQERRA